MLLAGACGAAADWPGHLGPGRDGRAPAQDLSAGPWKTLWRKEVGHGFAAPAVAGGKLVLFHRLEDREVVACLDARTGGELWSHDYPTTYKAQYGDDEGPRATPTIAQDRVYTFGADGIFCAWQLADGKRLWSVDVKNRLRADPGSFGFASSPLVVGKLAILNLGGKGAGMAAFEIDSGRVSWSVLDDEAGCSSPVLFESKGQPRVACLTGAALNIVEPAAGQVMARYPFRTKKAASVNAATPIVVGDAIFISAAYGSGAALVRFDGKALTRVWSADDALSCHYSTPVHADGFLYGFHGRNAYGADLRCIDFKTGRVLWSVERFGFGSIISAGERLLIQTTKGELIVAPANAKEFKPVARWQVAGPGGRACSALTDGLYFVRDPSFLSCIDLRSVKR